MIIANKKQLKSKMARAGYTGSGLAKAAGISQSYIVQIMSGKKTILATTAKKICETLNCEFDDIFIER